MVLFNDTATTEIYALSRHDALPILARAGLAAAELPVHPRAAPLGPAGRRRDRHPAGRRGRARQRLGGVRSEEHTSELQSRQYLVCRLLLEKNKTPVSPLPRLQSFSC